MVFVGYSDEHPSGTFRLLNWSTKNIMFSRDVVWLGIMIGDYLKKKKKLKRIKLKK